MLTQVIFDEWAMTMGELPLMYDIADNHADDMHVLFGLNRVLKKMYDDHELPLIVRRYSPKLGANMLEFLARNRNGASVIIEEFNRVYSKETGQR